MNIRIDADKIVVLGNGKLLEEGNHQSLYKEGTFYYNMWKNNNLNKSRVFL
jgi:ATP-binding cassette subfamily B protein